MTQLQYIPSLNHKVLNVQYLKPVKAIPNDSMKKFIATRQNLDRNVQEQNDLYDKISHYMLHYAPAEVDITEPLRTYAIGGTRVSWGEEASSMPI